MLHNIVDTNIYSGIKMYKMLKDIKLNSTDKLGATSGTNFEKYMLLIKSNCKKHKIIILTIVHYFPFIHSLQRVLENVLDPL